MKSVKEEVLEEIHKPSSKLSRLFKIALDPEIRGKFRRSAQYRPVTGKVKGMNISGPVLRQKPAAYGIKGVYNALVSKWGSDESGAKDYVK